MDCLSENINLKFDVPEHDLMVVIATVKEIVKWNEGIVSYRPYFTPCLVEGGPTLVFLITGLAETKQHCKDNNIDHVEVIENMTKEIIEMCYMSADNFACTSIADIKLPLVTFVDIDDMVRFRRAMLDIAKLFTLEKTNGKKKKNNEEQSVFLTDRFSFFE